MKIYIERENKTLNMEIEDKKKIIDILNELNISPETVIVVKNGEVVTEDVNVSDDDELKILSVISGG